MPYTASETDRTISRFLSGIAALVELPILQRLHDASRGLDTAGLISGYRGSPLGAYDQMLWRETARLRENKIQFQPGLNEDLAATAIWGAQMHKAFGDVEVEGVFGIWYGKGPGVDRSGDVFRNANMLGASPSGGVLAIAGDDHAAQSSMFPHQTDGILQSVKMPVLQPSCVEDILNLGLAGLELSRYCGLWVGFKTVAEIVESSATVSLPVERPNWVVPHQSLPPHGLNWDARLRWPEERAELERRQIEERLPAALDWIKANRLNRVIHRPPQTRLILATTGKAHQDLLQALSDLGLEDAILDEIGIGIFKYGCSWPVSAEEIIDAFGSVEEILVIEEKSPIIEHQLKTGLYKATSSPRITGKTDGEGQPLLRETFEFSPLDVARAVVERIAALKEKGSAAHPLNGMRQRLSGLEQDAAPRLNDPIIARKPFFCSGCPHNTSTRTPDGSIAGGGIGCHVMALSQPSLKTTTFCQMGGEGAQWIGASPFSKTQHIFQNVGDGTYEHSAILAIRAAVAAGTSITFKILFNDAVAMTGGQPLEGSTSPLNIVSQLKAENVSEVVLISDEPGKWHHHSALNSVKVFHRDQLDAVQCRLRDVKGVTAIVYEQTCAAEKRRRRKRKTYPDPARRIFINTRVCEGCGDCSVQSNCIAVEPVETKLGWKRRINQSSCNKDYSCLKGFCPSFIDVENPVIRKPDSRQVEAAELELFAHLPEPVIVPPPDVFNIYVAGIGGLGVLTLGALLGKAGEIDGLQTAVLDFTGLAQKNGAVVSHVRMASGAGSIHAVRIPDGKTDLLLAADSLVAAAESNLRKMTADRTAAVINTDDASTADNVMDRDFRVPTDQALARLDSQTDPARRYKLSLNRMAERIFGNAIAGNMMILGFAWQKGLVPIRKPAILEAIRRNGAAPSMNVRAFEWGRTIAHEPDAWLTIGTGQGNSAARACWTAEDFANDLRDYQSEAYAQLYREVVSCAREAASEIGPLADRLLRDVERFAYKVMAYKDEYEVARLYDSEDFRRSLEAQFSNWKSIRVWLAPPSLSLWGRKNAMARKRRFGPWVFHFLAFIKRLKFLRGTVFDPFGYSRERAAERALRDDYLNLVRHISSKMTPDNLHLAERLVGMPDAIRGFGHVKEEAMTKAFQEMEADLEAFNATGEA